VSRGLRLAALSVAAGAVALGPACASHARPPASRPAPTRPATPPTRPAASSGAPREAPAAPGPPRAASPLPLAAALDAVFDDPLLARALVAVRVDTLGAAPTTLYARNSGTLVMPASNMKLLTLAVAADRLGWDYRYETRLEATGPIDQGVLHGDLVVVGGGDPTIAPADAAPSPVFAEWIDALRQAGISRVDGRIVGDDRLFEGAGLGPGWSWDYLAAGYAAPTSALSYNTNQVALQIAPGAVAGDPASIDVLPAGHGLFVENEVTTGAAGAPASVDLIRMPGDARLVVRGAVPAGGGPVARSAAVDEPAKFFAESFRLAVEAAGIPVRDGAWAVGDLAAPPADAGRTVLARHLSAPLSEFAGPFMKASVNFDSEMLVRTIGLVATNHGTTTAGRDAERLTLEAWGVPPDAVVIADGSGLSRYNFVSADAVVAVLTHVWQDDRLRDPFVAALPVAGVDGTLASRMRGTALAGRVEAKTGTIANVRALSGFLETSSGGHLAFSAIVNNFTAPSADVDAIVERALLKIAGG